jgi:hypothetical protein
VFFHDGQEGFLVFVLSMDGEAAMMIFRSTCIFLIVNVLRLRSATKLWKSRVFMIESLLCLSLLGSWWMMGGKGRTTTSKSQVAS